MDRCGGAPHPENELYIGTMVQGRETTPNYKVKTRIYQPPEKWSRIANAHEPIISPMIFARVQYCLSLDTRSAPHSKQVYLFSGLLVCADCGQPMIRHPVQRKGKELLFEDHRFYDIRRNGIDYVRRELPEAFGKLTDQDIKDGALYMDIALPLLSND